MRIYPTLQAADAKEMRHQGKLGFTMVEIAIAIGVIGFALVAIIGILPTGMNVQKDNREDTVISQDAPYFLDAIRNGAVVANGSLNLTNPSAQSLDFLTNYVQSIKYTYYSNGAVLYSTNFPNPDFPALSGAEIVGLLSAPQQLYNYPGFSSNYFDTVATVRALSGPATAQNGLNPVMSFTYQMEVMITPFNSFGPDSTNWSYYAGLPGVDPNQVLYRSNRWWEANFTQGSPGSGALQYNMFDVRLHFSWPVLPNGSVGPGRQTYRSIIAGQMALAPANGVNGWFCQPQSYNNVSPNGL